MPKTTLCNKCRRQSIWFNWDAKAGEPGRSDFGKLIPLQVSEDGELLNERHQCPNSTWVKQPQSQQEQQQPQSQQPPSNRATLSQDTLYSIVGKLEKLNIDLEGFSTMIRTSNESMLERLDAIVERLKEQARDPDEVEYDDSLDRDGDSQRENPEEEP